MSDAMMRIMKINKIIVGMNENDNNKKMMRTMRTIIG